MHVHMRHFCLQKVHTYTAVMQQQEKESDFVFLSVLGQKLQEYVVRYNNDDTNIRTCKVDYVACSA